MKNAGRYVYFLIVFALLYCGIVTTVACGYQQKGLETMNRSTSMYMSAMIARYDNNPLEQEHRMEAETLKSEALAYYQKAKKITQQYLPSFLVSKK